MGKEMPNKWAYGFEVLSDSWFFGDNGLWALISYLNETI